MAKSPLYRQFKRPGGFIGLPCIIFESEAYRRLSLTARCLLDELQNLYRPGRNGRIVLSVSQASKRLNVSEETARPAFHELIRLGFIERNLDADWSNGKAREWRLTFQEYNGHEPTDEWKS